MFECVIDFGSRIPEVFYFSKQILYFFVLKSTQSQIVQQTNPSFLLSSPSEFCDCEHPPSLLILVISSHNMFHSIVPNQQPKSSKMFKIGRISKVCRILYRIIRFRQLVSIVAKKSRINRTVNIQEEVRNVFLIDHFGKVSEEFTVKLKLKAVW